MSKECTIVAPWRMEPTTKTCVTPLNFEPHPAAFAFGCAFGGFLCSSHRSSSFLRLSFGDYSFLGQSGEKSAPFSGTGLGRFSPNLRDKATKSHHWTAIQSWIHLRLCCVRLLWEPEKGATGVAYVLFSSWEFSAFHEPTAVKMDPPQQRNA